MRNEISVFRFQFSVDGVGEDVVLLLHTEPMVEVLVHTDGVSIERDEVLPCAVVHL